MEAIADGASEEGHSPTIKVNKHKMRLLRYQVQLFRGQLHEVGSIIRLMAFTI